MKAVYINSAIPEKEAKRRFCFPENIMMENAAAALEKEVLAQNPESVLVLCGRGNNGGDGYALSRRIFGKVKNVLVVSFGEPATEEAALQKKMCLSVGVRITGAEEWSGIVQDSLNLSSFDVIVDCIFGTGFHGELPQDAKSALEWANVQPAARIACDVPSGMCFAADKTVTMGALKTVLFKDEVKDFAGDIVVADLGISSEVFESCAEPDGYLIEEKDIKLPVRTKKSVHKGDFGHVCVVSGEKCGAGIIAGTAALRLGRSEAAETAVQRAVDFVLNMENPAIVLDADFFYSRNLAFALEKLNSMKNARVILTPHPKELCALVNALNMKIENLPPEKNEKSGGKYSLSDVVNFRFEFGKAFSVKFPNITLVAKGANTYIFSGKKAFICDKGENSLAKAGSGDVLAGLCAALLAQGYSARDAALTAVYAHASASKKFEYNFECTPFGLIGRISDL